MLYKIILTGITVILYSCTTLERSNDYSYLPDHNGKEARIFSEQCGGCHVPPHPARHGFPEWEQVLVMMQERMIERDFPLPNDETWKIVLSYLQEHARRD